MPGNNVNNCVRIFGNSQNSCFWCIYERYISTKYQLHHQHLEQYLILKNLSKLPIFMSSLLCLYFSWYVYIGAGKIDNIKCNLITSTTTFGVYIEYVSDKKCYPHYFSLELYYIQQKHDQNFRHLYYHYCVSTSVGISLLGQGK